MIVDSALYRQGARHSGVGADGLVGLRARASQAGDFVWVGLHEPTQGELSDVAEVFGLHPLAVEDAVKAHQRPKLEQYDDFLFLILKTLWYVDAEDAVETGEIHMFVGRDFIVTVRHGAGAELHSARGILESRQSVLLHGPAAVVYAVTDRVVDGYTEVVDALAVDVDQVESSVFSPSRTNHSLRIYALKREIAEVRRAVLPLREPMGRLVGGQLAHIPGDTTPFFRDVADHLTRAAEAVDSLDALLSTAFEAHLAGIQVRQNEDMRKISAGVALIAVPTMIAGIYGMNFRHMPELGWQYGYPAVLALMAAASGALWVVFKRSGWL